MKVDSIHYLCIVALAAGCSLQKKTSGTSEILILINIFVIMQVDNADRTSVNEESPAMIHINKFAAPEGSRGSSLMPESADSD